MLWHLPLEPFKLRYTADWFDSFAKEYAKNGVDYTYIVGDSLTDQIEKGRFLDIYNTIYWKSTQMAQLARRFRHGDVRSGDVFLTTDLWHPGFEAIPYMSALSEIETRLFGILHAGTYDPHDFTAQAGLDKLGAASHEEGWIESCERVFVATKFHRDLILKSRAIDPKKIVVTGIPFYGADLARRYLPAEKVKNRVVFPNRLNKEKNPHLFDALADALGPEYECIKSMEVFTTKEDYFRLLSTASVVVSFSDQETFGYAMLESAALGCSLVVPNSVSYVEMYPDVNRFDDFEDAVDKVKQFCEKPSPVPADFYEKYAYSTDRMLAYMGLLD